MCAGWQYPNYRTVGREAHRGVTPCCFGRGSLEYQCAAGSLDDSSRIDSIKLLQGCRFEAVFYENFSCELFAADRIGVFPCEITASGRNGKGHFV